MTPSPQQSSYRAYLPPGASTGFVVAVIAVLIIAALSYASVLNQAAVTARVRQAVTTVDLLQALLSTVKDAETGQRGYLLTGSAQYLAPYNDARAALDAELARLRVLFANSPEQRQRLDVASQSVGQKMAELEETISLYRSGKREEALNVVQTDRGKLAMDRSRELILEMAGSEREELLTRQTDAQAAANRSLRVTGLGSAMLLGLIVAAALMTSRNYRAHEAEAWIRSIQAGLAERMQGDRALGPLGDRLLGYLAAVLDAQVGALYVVADAGTLRRVAGYALPEAAGPALVQTGEGLLGQAVKERRALRVTDVPAEHFPISSSLGKSAPRELLVAPTIADGHVYGVLELGFFHSVSAVETRLLDRASEAIGIAVRSATDRSRLEALLEETQRQAEELQTQQEELRVNNEELEEQSRILRESQARLETQQAELEQTNTHLEEQTEVLQQQKEALGLAKASLSAKASDLERANQYKSEFLANMSHELRTPLNSSLILAKLLADNKDQNLTPEQVKYAHTITSAGNDLLALINDILDLAKIESGKVDLAIEPVRVGPLLDGLTKTFEPLAREKGVRFVTSIDPGTADHLETDAQRLGQILKNLLSNAVKFTAAGEISLQVSMQGDRVAFTVRDTGIGIAPDQQEIIFEAFRQADGSTHRNYGGTGLGLSISRDLARMLGGDVVVHSALAEGSAFTVSLPLSLPAVSAQPGESPSRPVSPVAAHAPSATTREVSPTIPRAGGIEDDRERLTPHSRLILVVEDDLRFATILRDLAHDMNFQCIVAPTANEALVLASAHPPHGILLDINLPDHSGLGVLDQLKRNPQTRHIPVHVASVADFTREAFELGAIGYMMKPVKREELVEAFHRLEAKLAQTVRRVLVVEDDERQRESITQLLAGPDVQIVGAATAADAIRQLEAATFDCLVMDLQLPDVSGYQLLDTMAAQEQVSFPPVIIYTGRSLTRDEEQRLRRFSKSIIIKDARSPERLLDEVTLFLHQVEASLPPERQRMLKAARDRDAALEGRRILVVEDDVRNVFALTSVLEPKGARIEIARNGREALEVLGRLQNADGASIDLVLMDIMMPEMDGLTAMREIRKRADWTRLPIIALTAKAMKDDQEKCLAAGANDYIAKPLDVEKLLSLVRVWMPK
jgi:CheY-like chemotaxis protein/signal transduction histidine kinase/CHASE3 domain sensor protein